MPVPGGGPGQRASEVNSDGLAAQVAFLVREAGPSEADADFGAGRHVIEALAERCARYPAKPA